MEKAIKHVLENQGPLMEALQTVDHQQWQLQELRTSLAQLNGVIAGLAGQQAGNNGIALASHSLVSGGSDDVQGEVLDKMPLKQQVPGQSSLPGPG